MSYYKPNDSTVKTRRDKSNVKKSCDCIDYDLNIKKGESISYLKFLLLVNHINRPHKKNYREEENGDESLQFVFLRPLFTKYPWNWHLNK